MSIMDKINENRKQAGPGGFITLMNFTFLPKMVNAVYHCEEETVVNHAGYTTAVYDPEKKLFNYINEFLNTNIMK